MQKKILGILLLALLSAGCIGEEKGDIFLFNQDSNGSDSNQIKVSVNDTTPNYLSPKLAAGSGITLAIQNPGGNENILISSTGGGGSGTTYTSGTPATLQVSNDTNTISLNFDGNFNTRFALRMPIAGDVNVSKIVNKLVAGGNISLSCTGSDSNGTCTITVNDLNLGGTYVRSTVFNSAWPVADANISSASRWNADINWTDIASIFPLGDANISSASTWNAKVSWTQLNAVVPWQDVNVADDITANKYLANAYLGNLFPVPDANVLNSVRYKQDSNCDNNTSCTLTGKITTTQDINAVNIRFTGTASGGDFNYSLGDANGSQSCPAGQALQSVGNTTSCIAVTGSGGSGRTYTSGTPATIEVNNDLNTISQNYDGNFWVRFKPAFDTNFVRSFDSNFMRSFDGNFMRAFDANFWTRFISAYDGNFWSRFSPAFDGNFYSKMGSLIPWQDVNVSDDLTINTTKDANFRNIKFNGTLSGGDFNFSLADANGSQVATSGQALSSVGASVVSIAIPPSLGSCDNNANCTFTGKITTTQDVNAKNIKFTGTLSGGDFNYSLGDANGSQTATAGQALSSVGATLTSIAIPPSLGTCDNNALCHLVTNFDANFKANVDINGILTIHDTNVSHVIQIIAPTNAIIFASTTVASFVTNSDSLQLQSNGSGGNAILTGFNAFVSLLNNTVDLGSATRFFRKLFVTDANVLHDLNVGNNIKYDGILSGGDANIGDINVTSIYSSGPGSIDTLVTNQLGVGYGISTYDLTVYNISRGVPVSVMNEGIYTCDAVCDYLDYSVTQMNTDYVCINAIDTSGPTSCSSNIKGTCICAGI